MMYEGWEDWRIGAERIGEEGAGEFWRKLRTDNGWTQAEVEQKTDGMVCWERQTMFEERPDLPTVQELEALAIIYGTSPGALLDRCFAELGKELRAEEEAQPVCPECGGEILSTRSSVVGIDRICVCENKHEFYRGEAVPRKKEES